MSGSGSPLLIGQGSYEGASGGGEEEGRSTHSFRVEVRLTACQPLVSEWERKGNAEGVNESE